MNATVRAAHRRRQLDKARQSASRPLAIWPPTGRRKGRLDKVLPARWQGEWGGTTWAFSKNLCTEACGCGFCASTRVQLPRATHPLLGLWFRRAAGAKVRVTRAPALPGAGPDGFPAALRHAVRGGASRPSGGFRRHRRHAAPQPLPTAASRREADKPASRGIRATRCAMLLQSGCVAGAA